MKTLINNSIHYIGKQNINIDRFNLSVLKKKFVSFSYRYLEDDLENSGFIQFDLPDSNELDIKNFIISQINIKLSEFVEEKNDIFVPNIETKEKEYVFNGNPDLDIRRYLR
jgi:hypothetical protein